MTPSDNPTPTIDPIRPSDTRKLAGRNLSVASLAEDLVRKYEAKIAGHRAYVTQMGVDPPEIADWQWAEEKT